ncbi:hypothetical protein [Hyphomicrobium sp.]|uniref:hypothetical protein n=1 Tax=Hyphomicrobium sp. TaxID=82 RepID=UPI002E352B09|nr:hypothetical protein [Hyphomicrobium sp.]HEX2841126.1 hypothetical protein [Hyphomicrobium sp.]
MTRNVPSFRTPLIIGALLLGSSFAMAGGPPGAAPAAPEAAIEGAQDAAPPPLDPTKSWPCVQGKVETLSVTQVWDGPSIDGLKGWFRDSELVTLIDLLSSRRVPLDQAEAAIKKYAEAQPENERDAKLSMLFAGLFEKVNGQRRTVMSGIEKYQKSQIARSKELERQSTEIAKLESTRDPNATEDTPDLAAAREKFNWAQRIFQERQGNVPLACELPILIEERLFALSRSIREQMKS